MNVIYDNNLDLRLDTDYLLTPGYRYETVKVVDYQSSVDASRKHTMTE